MNFQLEKAASTGTASLSGLLMTMRCAPGGSAGATTFSVFVSTNVTAAVFPPEGNVGAILKSAVAHRESCALSRGGTSRTDWSKSARNLVRVEAAQICAGDA